MTEETPKKEIDYTTGSSDSDSDTDSELDINNMHSDTDSDTDSDSSSDEDKNNRNSKNNKNKKNNTNNKNNKKRNNKNSNNNNNNKKKKPNEPSENPGIITIIIEHIDPDIEKNNDDDMSDSKSNRTNNKHNTVKNNKLFNMMKSVNKRPVNSTKKKIYKCDNPLCDHKDWDESDTLIVMPNKTKIENIDDLIEMGKLYHCRKNAEYNGINMRILNNLVAPLTELKNMVGMKSVKEAIVDQILFFLQGFNKKAKCNACIDCTYNLPCARNYDDMLHTIITGPPGVGKTVLGKILAKVYKEMGVLSKGHFTLVKRSDLVGKYLGHTAVKTQEKINQCMGGVMFIDEAYSLGNKEGRDSFSKECLDTLNQNLTENRDLLVIIAGYSESLEDSFFNMNEGLKRRFSFRYDIEKYTASELMEIFLLKLENDNWKMGKNVDRKELLKFFDKNHAIFRNYGGDVETLLLNCKIAHCRRTLFIKPEDRKILTIEDISDGLDNFSKHRKDNDPFLDFPKHLFI